MRQRALMIWFASLMNIGKPPTWQYVTCKIYESYFLIKKPHAWQLAFKKILAWPISKPLMRQLIT